MRGFEDLEKAVAEISCRRLVRSKRIWQTCLRLTEETATLLNGWQDLFAGKRKTGLTWIPKGRS